MNIKNNSTSADNQDDAFFEEYLQGESPLSELYQKTDCPEPSDELEQSILNAAIKNNQSTNVKKPQNWQQPISWAASIAIFSLVGLLTLNTWQTEQEILERNLLEEELLQPQITNEEYDVFAPVSPNGVHLDSNSHLKKRNKPLGQSKDPIPQAVKNDSRKLLYKSEAAPEMQAAPAYMGRSQISTLSKSKNAQLEATNNNRPSSSIVTDEIMETKQSTYGVPQKQNFTPSTEQETWLDRVRLLINKHKLDEAHELIRQFRIKYPDYPIDPIILQNLAPY